MHRLSNKRAGPMLRGLFDEEGAAYIEFALVAPIVLLLGMTAVDFGFYALSALQVNAALEAGVLYTNAYVSRYGWNWTNPLTSTTSNSANEINAVVRQALTGTPGIQTLTSSATCSWGCASGTSVSLNTSLACTSAVGTYCNSTGQAPGQFVTITASMPTQANFVSPLSGVLLPASVSGTAFVRVQ